MYQISNNTVSNTPILVLINWQIAYKLVIKLHCSVHSTLLLLLLLLLIIIIIIITRLPLANACIFGHVTKMAVTSFDLPCPKTPCYPQTSRLYLRTGIIADSSVTHLEKRISQSCCCCDLDLNPMTFIYELDPYPLKMCLQIKNKGFQNLSYYIQTDIVQTDPTKTSSRLFDDNKLDDEEAELQKTRSIREREL